jgi:hypothetical protein
MATMVPNRRSTFGLNCVRCKDELIAPEKSEYRHGTHIRHLWCCSNCETSFESLESTPVEATTTDDIFPSKLSRKWELATLRPSGIFVTLHGV